MTALATQADVEALADELTAAADAIHKRIVKELDHGKGAAVPEPDQAAYRVMLDDELVLRQRANALYAEAAAATVKTLAASQQQVIKLTQDAAEKIRTIGRISGALYVTAALGAVAGAAVTGNPVAIITALDKLRRTVKKVDAAG
ncbi:hypothetical protein E4L96_17275 [Massilia arenosa]|uniref:Uncharacterized protein n=1 Tax=Zemynaea arenosa TaxID=2561931 RepID=A0A4Y9S7K2_9BURK|nr:hypothetical protein [Massilia arenosa]TFW16018.1 hypothetical protein E4L96_17275 [Massilia arenosa]